MLCPSHQKERLSRRFGISTLGEDQEEAYWRSPRHFSVSHSKLRRIERGLQSVICSCERRSGIWRGFWKQHAAANILWRSPVGPLVCIKTVWRHDERLWSCLVQLLVTEYAIFGSKKILLGTVNESSDNWKGGPENAVLSRDHSRKGQTKYVERWIHVISQL